MEPIINILNVLFYWTGLLSWAFTSLIVLHFSLEPVRRFMRLERAVRKYLEGEEAIIGIASKRLFSLVFAWEKRGGHVIEKDFPGASKSFYYKSR